MRGSVPILVAASLLASQYLLPGCAVKFEDWALVEEATGGGEASLPEGGEGGGGDPLASAGGTGGVATGGVLTGGGGGAVPGAGGAAPTGGTAGSGGLAPTGGTAGSGGLAPTGGTAGSGGLAPTGGTAGGALPAAGGTQPDGGAAAAGGVTAGVGGVLTGGGSGAAPGGGGGGADGGAGGAGDCILRERIPWQDLELGSCCCCGATCDQFHGFCEDGVTDRIDVRTPELRAGAVVVEAWASIAVDETQPDTWPRLWVEWFQADAMRVPGLPVSRLWFDVGAMPRGVLTLRADQINGPNDQERDLNVDAVELWECAP